MVNWLGIVNWEDWPFILENRIWGVSSKNKDLLYQMLPGEYLIFYVRPFIQIRGIYRVISDPQVLEDKLVIDGYKFPMTFEHIIHLRESLIPDRYLDFRAVIPFLDLFPNKSLWMLKLQGTPIMPLSDHDYQIIREMLKTQKVGLVITQPTSRSGAWKTFRSYEGRRAGGYF